MIYHVKDDPTLQVSSQEPKTYSKYKLRGQGLLDKLLIMHCISWRSMTSRMNPSFESPVRNHQCPLSIVFEDGGFLTYVWSFYRAEIWYTSQESHIITIHDIKDDPILEVFSKEPSTFSQILTLRTGGSWRTSNQGKNISWWSMMSKITPSSQDSYQEPSTSSKYDFKDGCDYIDSWYGRYPEIFLKILYDLAEKGEGRIRRMLMDPDWRLGRWVSSLHHR